MNVTCVVDPTKSPSTPAVTLIDGIARTQIGEDDRDSPLYYQSLKWLKELKGYGACLNTNSSADCQPLLCTPPKSIFTFICGVEDLAIGNYALRK